MHVQIIEIALSTVLIGPNTNLTLVLQERSVGLDVTDVSSKLHAVRSHPSNKDRVYDTRVVEKELN